MKLASWTLLKFDGYPNALKWSSHDWIWWKVWYIIYICWVCGMFGCPPNAVGAEVCQSVAACGDGLGRMPRDWMPLL